MCNDWQYHVANFESLTATFTGSRQAALSTLVGRAFYYRYSGTGSGNHGPIVHVVARVPSLQFAARHALQPPAILSPLLPKQREIIFPDLGGGSFLGPAPQLRK